MIKIYSLDEIECLIKRKTRTMLSMLPKANDTQNIMAMIL